MQTSRHESRKAGVDLPLYTSSCTSPCCKGRPHTGVESTNSSGLQPNSSGTLSHRLLQSEGEGR